MPLISIIIRTKNEERWIGRCLQMIFKQKITDFEVILVDSQSKDHTVEIAKKFPIKILTIDNYFPGKAINLGVQTSNSKFFVCLSAHCIPKDEYWLTHLLRNMEVEAVAGVYGRQLPFSYSSDLDKRDLLITFGLDHRIQTKDSFFHNANSLIRRSIWEKIPFDEKATNIEDRIWGKAVIASGFKLAYEPEAAVYHYHGIHQNRDQDRCQNIVKIMESLHGFNDYEAIPIGFRPETMKTVAILPVLGDIISIEGHNLLERCIQQIKKAKYISKIIIISENEHALHLGKKLGGTTFQRPTELMEPSIGVEKVLHYALKQCETGNELFDAVLYVNYLYPFRPEDFFDRLIKDFCLSGVDSMVPTLKDYQPFWIEKEGKMMRGTSSFEPRKFKTPLQRGMVGLGSITSSEFVRKGDLLGENIALISFEEILYSIKAGDSFSQSVITLALEKGLHALGVKS